MNRAFPYSRRRVSAADSTHGMLATILIILTIAYFLTRVYAEAILDRGAFSSIFAVVSAPLVIWGLVRNRLTLTELWAFFFACWVVAIYLATLGARDLNTATANIALYQYIVPLGAISLGRAITRDNKQRYVIASFVLLAVGTISIGLIWHSLGAVLTPEAYLLDRTTIGGYVLLRLTSPAGNSLATGYVAAIAACAAMASGGRWLAALPLLLIGIGESFSRGAFLFFSAGVGVVAVAWLHRNRFHSTAGALGTKFLTRVVAAIGLVSLVVILAPSGRAFYEERFIDGLVSMTEHGNVSRIAAWQSTIEYWLQHPLTGGGLGKLGASAVERGVLDFAPESMYLKVAGELGIIGLALYAGVLVVALRTMLRVEWWRHPPVLVALAVVFGSLTASLILQLLEYDFFGVIFWFCVGMGVEAANRARQMHSYAPDGAKVWSE